MIFYEWLEHIKSIGVFLICAQSLIYFRGGGSYGKYLRLLVSIMLLVQLMEPLGRMMGILDSGEIEQTIQTMERKWSQTGGQIPGLEEDAKGIWEIFLENTYKQEE